MFSRQIFDVVGSKKKKKKKKKLTVVEMSLGCSHRLYAYAHGILFLRVL